MDYKLPYRWWRSGDDGGKFGKNKKGKGLTTMRNDKGFMCCLGAFAKQCGVEPHGASPAITASAVKKVYDDAMVCKAVAPGTYYKDTALAVELMEINDDNSLTTRERIIALRDMLEEHGHTLTLTSIPKHLKDIQFKNPEPVSA